MKAPPQHSVFIRFQLWPVDDAKILAALAILAIYPKTLEKNPKLYMTNPWQPKAHKRK